MFAGDDFEMSAKASNTLGKPADSVRSDTALTVVGALSAFLRHSRLGISGSAGIGHGDIFYSLRMIEKIDIFGRVLLWAIAGRQTVSAVRLPSLTRILRPQTRPGCLFPFRGFAAAGDYSGQVTET